jgi:membrane protease YdiL (CAAX protease family)
MAAELKGNPVLLAERVAISVLVVGPVEEFICRGFLFLRLTKLFGGSTLAVAAALMLQLVFSASYTPISIYTVSS